MVEDFVRSNGFLTLGSRLKRIGERLQTDSLHIAEALQAEVQTSHYPFLGALDLEGPMTIGELANAVGITQPGTTRTVGHLVKLGLVTITASAEDKRVRIVSLTALGQEKVDYGKKIVWPRIEAAVRDLCQQLDGPLLGQLAAMEDGLAKTSLDRRIDTGETT